MSLPTELCRRHLPASVGFVDIAAVLYGAITVYLHGLNVLAVDFDDAKLKLPNGWGCLLGLAGFLLAVVLYDVLYPFVTADK